jgi:hypothetical protein
VLPVRGHAMPTPRASRRVPSPYGRRATRAVPGTWRRRVAPLGASQSQRSARNGTWRPRASVTDDARAAVARLLLRGSQIRNGSRHSGGGSRGRGCMETGGAGAAVGLEGGEVGEVKSVEMSSLIRGRSSRAGEGECLMFYFLNGAQSWRAPAEQRQGSDVNACTGPTTSSCFPCQQDGTWHRQLGSHLGNQIRHMDRPSIVPCQSHTHPYHPLEQQRPEGARVE